MTRRMPMAFPPLALLALLMLATSAAGCCRRCATAAVDTTTVEASRVAVTTLGPVPVDDFEAQFRAMAAEADARRRRVAFVPVPAPALPPAPVLAPAPTSARIEDLRTLAERVKISYPPVPVRAGVEIPVTLPVVAPPDVVPLLRYQIDPAAPLPAYAVLDEASGAIVPSGLALPTGPSPSAIVNVSAGGFVVGFARVDFVAAP